MLKSLRWLEKRLVNRARFHLDEARRVLKGTRQVSRALKNIIQNITKNLWFVSKRLLCSYRFAKIGLVFLAICNTGLFGWYVDSLPSGRENPSNYEPHVMMAKKSLLSEFAKPIIERAGEEVSRGEYSMVKYFEDILKIYKFEKEKLGYPAATISNLIIKWLWNIVVESNIYRYSTEDYKEAQSKVEKYLGREEKSTDWFEEIKRISVWLFVFYIKNLLTAAALYTIWILEAKKKDQHHRLTLSSIVGFFLLVPAYPIVVSYFWMKALRETTNRLTKETEIRRRKRKLFSWLTPYEKRLTQRLSQNQLRSHLEGQQIHHSFLAALLVTLVMIVFQGLATWQYQVVRVVLVTEILLVAQEENEEQIRGPTNPAGQYVPMPSLGAWLFALPPLCQCWFHCAEEHWRKWLIPKMIDHVPQGCSVANLAIVKIATE